MAKNNTNIWKIVTVLFIIGSAAVGIALTFGGLQKEVTDHSEDIKAHSETIEFHDRAIVEIKADFRYMKEDVGEIKDGMKEQTTILEEIRREVSK